MLKNQAGTGYTTRQTVGSDEIEQIYRELVVELAKPNHLLQPKGLKWAYGTSLANRRERSTAGVVIEIGLDHLAQRIYQGVMALSTDEEIQAHLDAQKLMREKILKMEVERKRQSVLV
jgi:hypothetical protein